MQYGRRAMATCCGDVLWRYMSDGGVGDREIDFHCTLLVASQVRLGSLVPFVSSRRVEARRIRTV